MTSLLFLAAVVAGGVGAALRYALDVVVTMLVGARFPWGILLINVTGSFALGFVTGLVPGSPFAVIFGEGLLGGYTTFSTVALTTALQFEDRRPIPAIVYATLTLVASVAAAAAGLFLAGAPAPTFAAVAAFNTCDTVHA